MYKRHIWGIGGLAGISLLLLSLVAASAQDKGKTKVADKKERPSIEESSSPAVGKKEPLLTQVIPLSASDAVQITDALKVMLGGPKTTGLYVEYFPHRKVLLLRGSVEQIQEAKNILKALGESEPKADGVRVFHLEKGNAATLAEALQRMLKDLRPNPVKVIVPSTTPPKKEPTKKHEEGLFDPKLSKGKEITLMALGNKLIVTTDDPQAMNLIVDIVRLCEEPTTICDFEVIPLKFARAIAVAQVLDEAFNGPRGKGGFSSNARVERIRIVADPSANLLLLRAHQLDALTIRNLVERSLDVTEVEHKDEQPLKGKKGFGKQKE